MLSSLSLYISPTATTSVLHSAMANSTPALASQFARSFRPSASFSHTTRPLLYTHSGGGVLARGTRHLTLKHIPPINRSRQFSTARVNYLSTTVPSAFSSTSSPKWRPPSEQCLEERPVLIVGAGNLGRRIALVWASASRPVTIYDEDPAALLEATEYITDNLGEYCTSHGTHPGHVCTTTDMRVATTTGRLEGISQPDEAKECELNSGAKGPWMVIECLPESLELKISLLSQLEHSLPCNCILASNSASLMTSEMAPHLHHPERLLNTHYFIPPRNLMVELMSSSKTHDEIFPFLAEQMRRVGLSPMIVPAGIQSQGFIFNRIWAACKRETLAVLAEGVAKPAEVDMLFRDFFHAEKGPCERMDEIGLDTVARVEGHYLEQRPKLDSARQLGWLTKNYVHQGKLGEKSGGGGLFSREEREAMKRKHSEKRHAAVEETTGA
ncbi:hypothetical protein B0H66DRAFT_255819 [Apodospora peruviana]|uniref:3-hydroxyacyl-CoA dehydrogenase n=1 Tax=Apodospora peruviana TaxID=516989 RepID=A0AAE0I7I1_9PEZI|nr:hypothetical protein B0H66DRAFT_255819 [Apodospora peruviana]